MNNPVSFEISKLLKEKGFKERPFYIKYDTEYIEGYDYDIEDEEDILKIREFQFEDNKCSHLYIRPTIADVIMWLYDKHKIWIGVTQELGARITFCSQVMGEHISASYKAYFKSPTDAYSSAIEYVLTKII